MVCEYNLVVLAVLFWLLLTVIMSIFTTDVQLR